MKKSLNKKNLEKILIFLAINFFILLIISFSFPDLFALFYVPNMLNEGNFYTLVKIKKPSCVWLDSPYPPLYYFTMGIYLKTIEYLRFLPAAIFNQNVCPVWDLILNKQFLFWAKLPFLVFHLLSALVFSKLFNKDNKKWFYFWLLNPIAIFVSFIEGQYDIIPIFFLLLAIYHARKKNRYLSFLFLGIAGAFKNFPFLLIFPFYFFLVRNFWEVIYLTIIVISPYLITTIPVFNSDYLSNSLLFPENYKMLDLGLNIGDEKISFYLVFYIVIFLIMIKEKIKSYEVLIKYVFLFSLIYFLTSFWFVQRLLFLIPSLLLISSKRKGIFDLLPFLYILYFLYALFLYPGLFDHTLLRPIFENLRPVNYNFMHFSLLKTIVFSSLTGVLSFMGYLVIKDTPQKELKIDGKAILYNLSGLFFYLIIIFFFVFIKF